MLVEIGGLDLKFRPGARGRGCVSHIVMQVFLRLSRTKWESRKELQQYGSLDSRTRRHRKDFRKRKTQSTVYVCVCVGVSTIIQTA